LFSFNANVSSSDRLSVLLLIQIETIQLLAEKQSLKYSTLIRLFYQVHFSSV